ncbi:uncharacterized protein LOC130052388 [Ostrea edulis]|uniref:uncharacterized protein LOC130052388 n=1 Tax=Ostrea edulis TaxID=37623 RepID=UPI0024AFA450|nr:uncharacterized protein LOC130052388 [Ostrea edulis]
MIVCGYLPWRMLVSTSAGQPLRHYIKSIINDMISDSVQIDKIQYQLTENIHNLENKISIEGKKRGEKLKREVEIPYCKSFENLTFKESLTETVKIVNSYNFTHIDKYLQRLQLDTKGIVHLTQQRENSTAPTIVSGFSDNHYDEAIGLFNSINNPVRKMYPDLKFVVFDLGLTEEHRKTVQKLCNCDVRRFPFENYPSHLKFLRGFTWKPVIIQMMLQEFDFVMWVDSSVRLNKNVDRLFERARYFGIQVVGGYGSIAVRTHNTLFDFLKEEPCLFNYPEVQGCWVAIKRSLFTLKVLLQPWVSCALQYGCMDFPYSKAFLTCSSMTHIFHCHRSDQSVLGILLTRLFHVNRQLFVFNDGEFGNVRRGSIEKFIQQDSGHA